MQTEPTVLPTSTVGLSRPIGYANLDNYLKVLFTYPPILYGISDIYMKNGFNGPFQVKFYARLGGGGSRHEIIKLSI